MILSPPKSVAPTLPFHFEIAEVSGTTKRIKSNSKNSEKCKCGPATSQMNKVSIKTNTKLTKCIDAY